MGVEPISDPPSYRVKKVEAITFTYIRCVKTSAVGFGLVWNPLEVEELCPDPKFNCDVTIFNETKITKVLIILYLFYDCSGSKYF